MNKLFFERLHFCCGVIFRLRSHRNRKISGHFFALISLFVCVYFSLTFILFFVMNDDDDSRFFVFELFYVALEELINCH